MRNFSFRASIAFVPVLLFVVSGSTVQAAALTRDLSLGSVGEDVRDLQRFLNSNTQTQVAISGAGSPGNETTYFGPATANAVLKLQALYPNETYKKAGLVSPTSYVGALTRQVINARLGYSSSVNYAGSGFIYNPETSALPLIPVPTYGAPLRTTSDMANESFRREVSAIIAQNNAAAYSYVDTLNTGSATSGSAQTAQQNETVEPMVTLIGPQIVETGDRVTVFGTALPRDLRAQIGKRYVQVKGLSKDDVEGYFIVPRALDEGVYDVTFSSKSVDNLQTPAVTLSVVEDVVIPTITSYPDVFEGGTSVTIKGKDFSEDNTYLIGAFGRVRATDASTTEATFLLPTIFQMTGQNVVIDQSQNQTLTMYIETELGVSETFAAVVRFK